MADELKIHWLKIKTRPMFGVVYVAQCGVTTNEEPGMKYTNYGPGATCELCLTAFYKEQIERKQKLCSFCSTPLEETDYQNKNDFFLSCFQHKRLAKIETEKFFKENPDYTKWNTDTIKPLTGTT